ncbi:MAG TPA: EamA family transporter [Dehalococcoidia bacterium]|nr:EamA family transporter [Dehalococcoidia bacterium]
MPALAVGLLLAAAVAHASWNYVAKGANGSAPFIFCFTLFSEILYLPLTIALLVWVRPALGPEVLAFAAVSGSLHAAYFLLLNRGYAIGDLSVVYPLARGTGPALSVVGAIVIFGERPSAVALAGAAMVVAGIVVMTWSPGSRRTAELGRSVLFALATGAMIAAYTLWDNQGVTMTTPIVYSYFLELMQLALFAPFVLGSAVRRSDVGRILREQRLAGGVIGVLSPGAYILVLVALTLAPVSYVAPAREISILFGAILGLRLLGESDAPRRLAGAAAIVAGVFALALG